MRAVGIVSPPAIAARSEADQARLRSAYRQNYAGVCRFLRRMRVTADRTDDAAQQVFLIAVEALPRIAAGSERAFLYETAFRLAHGMRRRGEREIPSLGLEFDPSPVPSPDQLTDQKRAREVLDTFVVELDADTRNVFVLTEFDGFTMPEIADLLDVPLGTATSRLRRAREKIHSMVSKIYGDKP
jgi:RNA polymerase sigma-70 factor (ECF subfamily)